jgi:hypothetical protein
MFYSPIAHSANVNIGEQTVVLNDRVRGHYSELFESLRDNHIEFTLEIPEYNVSFTVDYYQQYGITNKDFTIGIIEKATELFFDWAASNGHTIENGRRTHRRLAIYDISYDTLNDQSIIHFTSYARRGEQRRVNAIYEAFNSHDNTNAIIIGADRNVTERTRSITLAHELAHWWCDYFRIYDRYYTNSSGTTEMEQPAYSFQRYYRDRLTR